MATTPRDTCLAAIRAQGDLLPETIESWEVPTNGGRQVFVTQRADAIEAGTPYPTWVVTLAADGGVIAIERFVSLACSGRRKTSK